jgi:hypothetical protein
MQDALSRLEKELGRASAPGRALLADANAFAKSHHHEIARQSAANDRLERDPALRDLRGQEKSLTAQFEEQEQALGMSGPLGAASYCANPNHHATRVCTMDRQLDAVRGKISQREAALQGNAQ